MTLSKSRSIISVLLTVVLAFSMTVLSFVFLVRGTFCNSAFIDRVMVSDELVGECENQLNMQFDALSAKSSIPSRVFKNIETENPIEDAVRHSVLMIYSNENSKAFFENKKDYFYNMCLEYLNGNNIKFKEDDVERTAREAAEIYTQTCTLQSSDYLRVIVNVIKDNSPGLALIAFVACLVCVVLMFVLYSGKNNSFGYVGAGISACGIALVFTALISLVSGFGKGVLISPQAYYEAFCSVLNLFFVFMILLGLLEAAVGTIVLLNVEAVKKRKSNRRSFKI